MNDRKIQGIIMGPTNVGKTTLLNKLEAVSGIKQIQLGKLTREGGLDPEIQKKLQEYVSNKQPVPAELVVSAILPFVNYFSRINENYFLDGVPRTIKEAEIFVREASNNKTLPNLLVSLIADSESIFQKILKRVDSGVRAEDLENYKIRFEQYQENKDKVFGFLQKYMDVFELDTTFRNADDVYNEVSRFLGVTKKEE
jgi:adenylate kinase family enzyme